MSHIKKFEDYSSAENTEEGNSKNNKGQFQKGHKPFNKGLKWDEYLDKDTIDKVAETSFKTGVTTGESHPSWKGGIQSHKRDGKFINTGTNERKRIARYNYEKVHGEIPPKWIIYHIDKDIDNDEIDNLIAVPRAILISLNNNRMNSNYHEIKTAVDLYLSNKNKSTNN